jgi:dTDP-4-amino-4,6-dideoxygalactose transaminase
MSKDASSVPFLDLVAPHLELEKELEDVFINALRTASFIGGPMVEEFELSFAKFCEVDHVIGVSNGTDALRFAILAAGIGPGDAVITVPNTFIATTEAISQVGARPYFVDIDEHTYTMSPDTLESFLITQCTFKSGRVVTNDLGLVVKAVLPVHLYGQMADLDPIAEIADKFGLVMIEDACQAHGAEYFSRRRQAWVKPGAIGVAAAYSFYPGKNLGACGEGGAVTTNNEDIARVIRMLRDHGQAKKYHHDIEGYNGRLDAIQAAILSVKLKHLPNWTKNRQRIAREYNSLFAASGAKLITPYEPDWSRSVYHLYVVRVAARESLQADLARHGVGTGIHYPVPLHLQRAYASLRYCSGQFPVTERVSSEILSLPMFPTLTADAQRLVVARVSDFCRNNIPVAVA